MSAAGALDGFSPLALAELKRAILKRPAPADASKQNIVEDWHGKHITPSWNITIHHVSFGILSCSIGFNLCFAGRLDIHGCFSSYLGWFVLITSWQGVLRRILRSNLVKGWWTFWTSVLTGIHMKLSGIGCGKVATYWPRIVTVMIS